MQRIDIAADVLAAAFGAAGNDDLAPQQLRRAPRCLAQPRLPPAHRIQQRRVPTRGKPTDAHPRRVKAPLRRVLPNAAHSQRRLYQRLRMQTSAVRPPQTVAQNERVIPHGRKAHGYRLHLPVRMRLIAAAGKNQQPRPGP